MRRVAALFVYADGPYASEPDVDLWDEKRDARTYAGTDPVVAHPPCARWGAMRFLVHATHGYKPGDDGGCFASALTNVRRCGGVLEHPAFSAAFAAFDLPRPVRGGGWIRGFCGGWSCYVEQRRFGHVTRKPTWLYMYGGNPPSMPWGRTVDKLKIACGLSAGSESNRLMKRAQAARDSGDAQLCEALMNEYRAARRENNAQRRLLSYRESSESPAEFRALLLSIARGSWVTRDAA